MKKGIFVPACRPCAGVWRALMKRSVSQGARSPISTCLLWSRGGTGFTLQSGSPLTRALLSGKSGSSPESSMWAFLDTRSRRIWVGCKGIINTRFKKTKKNPNLFPVVSPHPPPCQTWRSVHGGSGESRRWKVPGTQLPDPMEQETAPWRLDLCQDYHNTWWTRTIWSTRTRAFWISASVDFHHSFVGKWWNLPQVI